MLKNLDQEIEKIEEDTLIIWGEKDSQTPLWMGKLLSEKIKNSRLEIIENATHGLPIKQPELVANLIYTYIKA
ncbi:MAG: Pimeloyl-(acyl-carrier protein) methyl ester esterase [candidate division WS6 bacterium OLB21]|uniref:Pimeloyl-(Acyl-carrier protein) methyl ester esterase n=1 Tax=candidate division WS6 bacterium OLB21 TaxID=1617427 RepID=A0A136KG52_9BACT|nr:MAG: Pimeloyl-(acyl-carrier protein) methyl ester esterase [candidate division WS6 bacterium OLB21]